MLNCCQDHTLTDINQREKLEILNRSIASISNLLEHAFERIKSLETKIAAKDETRSDEENRMLLSLGYLVKDIAEADCLVDESHFIFANYRNKAKKLIHEMENRNIKI